MMLKKVALFIIGIILASLLIGFVIVITFNNGENPQVMKTTVEYKDIARPVSGIIINAKDYVKNDNADVTVLSELNGRNSVLKWLEKGYLEWEVEVSKDGDYNIGLGYHPLEGRSRDIEFNCYLDEENQSTPAKVNRLWKDSTVILRTENGNDMRPKQIEARIWSDQLLKIPSTGDVLSISLKKGKHRLKLESVREPIALDYLRIIPVTKLQNYDEYFHELASYTYTKNYFIKIQAENAYLKSSPALYPTFDRTSPLTEPYHPTQMRLNTIGNGNWDELSQWISFKVNVPEDGLYKIGVRYHQNKAKGFFVSRKIYIDDKIPFAEMTDVRFPYDVGWKMKVVGKDDNNPYMFYLTKGVHEVKMEVTLGKLVKTIDDMQKTVYELNDIYRKIIMITGTTPDQYRDYELDKNIPDLISDFKKQIQSLKNYSETLDILLGGKSAASGTLLQLAIQICHMKRRNSFMG